MTKIRTESTTRVNSITEVRKNQIFQKGDFSRLVLSLVPLKGRWRATATKALGPLWRPFRGLAERPSTLLDLPSLFAVCQRALARVVVAMPPPPKAETLRWLAVDAAGHCWMATTEGNRLLDRAYNMFKERV
jgi:hypothetical protein